MKSGNKGGRPTKYKQEYCQEFLDYFSIDPYRIETKQIKSKDGSYEVEEKVINDFPTLAGFAIKIGVNRDTLLEWANAKNEDGSYKHEEFSGIYKRAKDYQENFLAVTVKDFASMKLKNSLRTNKKCLPQSLLFNR